MGDLPSSGMEPQVSCIAQADSSPAEPQGKPKNTGVGSLSLHQRIFLTEESNRSLLHCRRILFQLSHQGSPRILGWVAYSFSSGSSQPRNRTRVSCTSGGFFTESPGKPKNTGAGSLSLLQGIFPTQESNQGLLRHTWSLYQLSYQGIPKKEKSS